MAGTTFRADLESVSSALDHQAVTPSDATTYAPPFRAVFVGGAGTITIRSVSGNDVQYTVPAGTRLDIVGTMVKATGTAATLIVAMF